MIALSAPTFDPLGHVPIDELPGSELGNIKRRVSRAATLGPEGAVINDGGYLVADRTLRVMWRPRDEREYQAVQRLVQIYALLHVATADGLYRAAPESVTIDQDGEAVLVLLVMEEIA